ncbi:MAG: hypothetical protein ACREQR_01450 [Candidatus Binataceae bacterium]
MPKKFRQLSGIDRECSRRRAAPGRRRELRVCYHREDSLVIIRNTQCEGAHHFCCGAARGEQSPSHYFLRPYDSILVGYYQERDLMYAARIRNGFTPASRRALFSNCDGLSISKCPFRNLPESSRGRWGEGLTGEDMKRCRWRRPRLVAAIEFLEWTQDARLRHPKFAGLRVDKVAREITRDSEGTGSGEHALNDK